MMLDQWLVSDNANFEYILRKRKIRSESGIVPIQVLTKPFRCPGKCIFCPNDFTMPKSYINTEPWAMRALLNHFDPYKQVYNRLISLTVTGHATDKIEMIVLWGTRDVYPQDYKHDFIWGLYDACNTFDEYYDHAHDDQGRYDTAHRDKTISDYHFSLSLIEAQNRNENARHRIIWLTVETRPEYVTDINCQFRRDLWVTRLEMGIQSLFDDVLDANKRGHNVQQCREAMHRLRQYGFKVSVHFMSGLYGSSYTKDIQTFQQAFEDPWIRPDEIKFYPTGVIPNTELYEMYRRGEYQVQPVDEMKKLIREVQIDHIPPYTRIKRLIRDIPANEVVWGNYVTNLRQLVMEEMNQEFSSDEQKRIWHYGKLYGDHVEYYQTLDDYIKILS